MPDYFVPLDTMKYTKFYRQLAAKNYIINTNLKYIDANRKQLKKQYTQFDKFLAGYEVPQEVVDTILAQAEKDKIKPKDKEELNKTLPFLRRQLKALVARDIWDMSQYYQIMNEDNDVVKKALEVIRK